MIKISTPVQGYNGIDCGVRFENGFAEVETLSEHVINWFKDHGYTVEGEPTVEANPEAGENSGEQPKTKAQLIEEAKELGIENIKSKATNAEIEKLIADKKAELEALENNDGNPKSGNPETGAPAGNPESGELGNEDPEKGE